MSEEFSTLPRLRPVKGKAQWVGASYVQTEADGTVVMDVPYLMPGTVIFVHGVNSIGEWYADAAKQLCVGLNKRLGRDDLARGARSPIIPFYWGYKMQPGDEKRYAGLPHDEHNAWGGGPFQNGTNNLLQFWQDGFKRKLLAGVIDLQRLNPDITRQLQDAPPRAYFIHAAKRRFENCEATLMSNRFSWRTSCGQQSSEHGIKFEHRRSARAIPPISAIRSGSSSSHYCRVQPILAALERQNFAR
jgi:hypothetical protein